MSPSLATTLYQFLDLELGLNEFEAWAYESSELEDLLGQDDYLTFISLNFLANGARHEAAKIIEKHIEVGGFHRYQLEKVLQAIVIPTKTVSRHLAECYDLYCDGYRFLGELGLNYGLGIYTMDELTEDERQERIAKFLPAASVEAQRVLNQLKDGEIVLSGYAEDDSPLRLTFIDRRLGTG